MKVQQLMERVNNFETGKIIAYIKDGLEDLNINFETHIMIQRLDIVKDQRFYDIPDNAIKILEVRALNHLNSKDEYRRIPRLVNKPWVPDGDDV